MREDVIVRKIQVQADLDQAFGIRHTVFVEEQHCPAELEMQHNEISVHFLAICNGLPCGAARWRKTGQGYKLERFAVLPAYRGRGVASALVQAILDDLPPNAAPVYLNAQLPAVPVYARNGFTPVGEVFEEAGIRHRQMLLMREADRR